MGLVRGFGAYCVYFLLVFGMFENIQIGSL